MAATGALEDIPLGDLDRVLGVDAAGAAKLGRVSEIVTAPTTGEIDIAVTSSTTLVLIGPATGNITIDQISGLRMGQVVPIMFVQGASAYTIGLAGTSNAVEHDAGATFTVEAGSGARTGFFVEGRWSAGGVVQPTIHLTGGPI